MPDIDTVLSWRGRPVVDVSGEKIGTLEEIYLDADTDRPEWGGVRSGLVRRREHLVPLGEATDAGDRLQVPWEKAHVEAAPDADPSEELSQSEEAELCRHYGIEYSEDESSTGLPAGEGRDASGTPARDSDDAPDAGDAGDDHAMTRSEEEVVDTGRRTVRPRERVRLKKYVVTDYVQKTVPVEREEIRVDHEPTEPTAEPRPDRAP